MKHLLLLGSILLVSLALIGCGDDEVDSEEGARQAYLGLDVAIDKSLNLGFDGFNAASSANIDPQTTAGTTSGTITVTGQVDSGSSDNKGMRLVVTLTQYSDLPMDADVYAVYQTRPTEDPMMLPALTLMLRNYPMTAGEMGTLEGTLIGPVGMSGDLEGEVTLNLTLAGMIELDPAGTGDVIRTAGTTHITGTATSSYGTYAVDVTR